MHADYGAVRLCRCWRRCRQVRHHEPPAATGYVGPCVLHTNGKCLNCGSPLWLCCCRLSDRHLQVRCCSDAFASLPGGATWGVLLAIGRTLRLRRRRDTMLRVAAAIGAIGGATLAAVLVFRLPIWAVFAAMAGLGAYRGIYNPPLESIFADSIVTGQRCEHSGTTCISLVDWCAVCRMQAVLTIARGVCTYLYWLLPCKHC